MYQNAQIQKKYSKTHFPQPPEKWMCNEIFITEENVHLPPLDFVYTGSIGRGEKIIHGIRSILDILLSFILLILGWGTKFKFAPERQLLSLRHCK